ncbi:hypothetical protein C9374_003539 [Naegleria lovaniensis]|uniref:t-SNARE coiled-coil homology domain-containing protein n=1 Tax=Naegleria lovaniensis TaxID=51637 RepID=A0AA88GT98_NAELO|nr:uncharacterized protein C9374_003539 [Naegleria lovaniensis]KAG2385724.1 hypothetical protein C9374_003539 [Naegleria lovaniensis]
MTELFNSYESDLEKLLSQIAIQVQSSSEGSTSSELKNINTAKNLIKQMNIEIQSITNVKQKGELKTKVNHYKQQVEKLEQELKKSNLLSGSSSFNGKTDHHAMDISSTSGDDHKQRMLNSTQILKNSSKTLEMADKVLNETEQIAQESAATVRQHSEKIKQIQDKMYDLESEVRQGRKTVDRMSRPAIVNLFMK